jgi:glycosyltransferase involved in cell wall biosynthesis
LVSVVIPTYYRNDRLVQAIESVQAQSYPTVETIVVDDSGEAHAESVVRSYDVEYVAMEENEGAQAARTRGISRGDGRYVQLLDDDDVLLPEKLRHQVELLESSPEVGVAYCGLIRDSGRVVRPNPDVRGDVLELALRFDMGPCLTSTMLIDGEKLSQVHPLTDYLGADDVGLKIELATRTEFDFVDNPLVRKGEPEESLGESWSAIKGRRMLIEEYGALYSEFPPEVRAHAISDMYRLAGRRYLKNSLWSPNAISAYTRAIRYAPTRSVLLYGELFASILGLPGYRLASRCFETVSRW